MGIVAGAAGLASAGSSIYGALTGSSNAQNVQLPTQFQMPGMTQAANSAQAGIGSLPATQYGQQFLPQYEQATQNLYNNPYAGQAQQGSLQAAQMGQQAAQGATQSGQQIQGYGQSLVPMAQGIANTAMDPQQALYARTQQQLQDQTRASAEARGIDSTPYGAGLENQAMSNFNIDWQNQQLQRQISGGQAAGGLVNQAGGLVNQGQGLISGAPGAYNQASSMPYNTAQGIGQGQQQAISNLFQGGQQAQGLAQTPIQDNLAYLGVGNQAGGVANQLAQVGLNQAQLGFNQNQTLGQNLGAGISGIGTAANNSNLNWLNSAGGSSGNIGGTGGFLGGLV